MNRKLAIFLMAFILAPSIMAPLAYGVTKTWDTTDQVGAVAWRGETGEFSADSPVIAITRPEFGVITGIGFPNVTLPKHALINQANLTLFTSIYNEPGNASITVYGYSGTLGPWLWIHPESFLIIFHTANFVNYEITAISPGYITIDVTKIVQELVTAPAWYEGAGMGFVIFASDGQPYKTIMGNQLNPQSRWPKLEVRYAEAPQYEEEEYITSYRNFNIFNKSLGWDIPKIWGMNFENNSVTKDMIFSYEGGKWVGAEVPFSWYLSTATSSDLIPGDQICVVGETIYALGENSTDSKAYLYRAEDWKNGNWTRLFEVCPNINYLEKTALAYDPQENLLYFFTNEHSDLAYGYYNLTGDNHQSRTVIYNAWSEIGHGLHAVYDPETGYVYATIGSRLVGGNDPLIRIYRFLNATSYDYREIGEDYWYPNMGFTNSSIIITYTYGTSLYYSSYNRFNFTQESTKTYINKAYSQPSEMIQMGNTTHDLRRSYDYNYRLMDFKFNGTGAYDKLLNIEYDETEIERLSGIYITPDTEGMLFKFTGVDDIFFVDDEDLLNSPSYGVDYFWANRTTGIRCDTVNFMVKNNWLGDIGGEGYVYVVRDENGTVVGEFDNLDDAYAFIDETLGPDPQDPNPPSQDWGSNTYFDRPHMKLYYLIVGLGFLLIPPLFLARNFSFRMAMITLTLMAFGWALLFQMKSL